MHEVDPTPERPARVSTTAEVVSSHHDDPQFFASLVEHLPICVLCKDREGQITYVNVTAAEAMGRSVDEIVGSTDFDLFPKHLAEKYRRDDLHVMQTGETLVDVEENRKGDQPIYFEVRKSPLRDAAGNTTGVKAVFWDVTGRRETEQALEHEQFLMRTLMDHIPDSIYFKDRESRFVRVSRGQAVKFGWEDPADVIGRTDADIFSEEHAEAARRDEEEIMRSGIPVLEKVERETWATKEDTWCSSTKLPLLNEQGDVVGTFGISRDVTDLMKTEEALRHAKDEADAANRAKSDFLANMSHEIRTPMNAVIGITELLLDDNPTPHQKEYLSMVLASGESLLAIINDILDFSKIEAGKFELFPAPCNLRNALGDTIKSLGVRAHQKGLELAFSVSPDVPELVNVDGGRLRQILINLVGNAIKFTQRGEVVVSIHQQSATDQETMLEFAVQDTGIGIPVDKQESIFAEFEQVDGSTTRAHCGTGLGLAISARLAQLMGGEINVKSEPGVGSTFRFTVRCGLVPESDSDHRNLIADLAGTPILVVDDNQTNRLILCEMIKNWGLESIAAASAQEALDALEAAWRRHSPAALVITDINMPVADGFALAESIRSHPQYQDLPIVALTSGARPGDTERCQQVRISHQISKPIKQSELMALIVDIVGRAQPEHETDTHSTAVIEPTTKRLHVLVAEDNPINQRLAVGVLERLGHEVTVASTGIEAVRLSKSIGFDIILMDVQMPEMDGYEATRLIRAGEEQKGEHVPIIALTARAMESDREECLAAGMDDFLPKPVRAHQLSAKLSPLIHAKTAEERVPAESRPPAAPGQVDWQRALANLHGNRHLLAEVIAALKQEAPKLLGELQDAVEAHDAKRIRLHAHSLKGSVMFLDAVSVIQPAQQLEALAATEAIDGADAWLVKIEGALDELLESLSSHPFT